MSEILHFRIPPKLSSELKAVAQERCRTISDVAREGLALHLRDLARHRRPAIDDRSPPEAA